MDEDENERTEEKFATRRIKRITVHVVRQEGESALVQLPDLRRVFIPISEVQDGKAAENVLEAGIPYGVPWEDVLEVPKLTAADIAQRLRKSGYYTSADIERNVKGADKAIKQAVGIHAGGLHNAARQYEEANK